MMKGSRKAGVAAVVWMALGLSGLAAEDPAAAPPGAAKNQCLICHGNSEVWEGETLRLFVGEKHLAADIHWQKGLRCRDCHGGDATTEEVREAHAVENGFRPIKSPADVPQFCGHCHSNVEYMRRYRPSPRTDQVAEYWTSGHGVRLKNTGDPKVATCVSCHSHHDIRAVADLEAPVYPTRLAKTCQVCHSDAELMAGREYHGRPLGHSQYQLWEKSVHAEALLKKGDLSAPTCNDCHGNHAAAPPDVDSVANACGTCHAKVAKLFAETRMRHRFEEVGLPGCSTCHGNHEVHHPTDEMLGMSGAAVCSGCHVEGRTEHGATLAGAEAAREMREGLQKLHDEIAAAEAELDRAERLGMEVRASRFRLRAARDALTNARSLVHGFAAAPMETAIDGGLGVTAEVRQEAEHALHQYTFRRVWLALSLIPILAVVGLLLLYIRRLPAPAR